MNLLQLLITTLVIFLICWSAMLWLQAIDRRMRGLPLLAANDQPAHPWGLIDLFLAIVLIYGATIAVQGTYFALQVKPDFPDVVRAGRVDTDQLPGPVQLDLMLAAQIGLSCGMLLTLGAVWLRTRATAADLGWPGLPTWRDWKLGGAAFAMLILPVYALQIALHTLLPESFFSKPHPILRILSEQPDPALLGRVFLIAVVLAPVIEELLFRVLLQGWLQNVDRAARHGQWWLPTRDGRLIHAMAGLLRGEPTSGAPGPLPESSATPGDFATAGDSVTAGDAWTARGATAGGAAARGSATAARGSAAGRWPIVASSALFAAAHWGNAMDPIPLFLLAFGLGYLYDRTQRIFPCILVHLLNNLLSFTLLSYALLHSQSA